MLSVFFCWVWPESPRKAVSRKRRGNCGTRNPACTYSPRETYRGHRRCCGAFVLEAGPILGRFSRIRTQRRTDGWRPEDGRMGTVKSDLSADDPVCENGGNETGQPGDWSGFFQETAEESRDGRAAPSGSRSRHGQNRREDLLTVRGEIPRPTGRGHILKGECRAKSAPNLGHGRRVGELLYSCRRRGTWADATAGDTRRDAPLAARAEAG